MQKFFRPFVLIGLVIVSVLFLNVISNILLPFVVGVILAYFLDPAADKLEIRGFSRGYATLFILLGFILCILLFSYTVGPILYNQLLAFIADIPLYGKIFHNAILPYLNNVYNKFGYQGDLSESILVKEMSEFTLKLTHNIFTNIWYSSIAIINLFSLIFITPIVTFYLLRDWDILLERLTILIPKKIKKEVVEQCGAIDFVLSAYIRGQTNVCLILGSFYAVGLTIVGLNFGFLIGFLTGIFTFIPYFGVFIGMCIGMAIALLQFDGYFAILSVLSVFLFGQFIEGNFITPKLVGKKVGIHPALIIFSLLAGGSLFGFLGILFAIPSIAVIGVISRFYVKKYVKSKFYLN